jgi:hypothetical protein
MKKHGEAWTGLKSFRPVKPAGHDPKQLRLKKIRTKRGSVCGATFITRAEEPLNFGR